MRMKRQSPYEVLGIREDASWREIAAAYRQKAQQYHPDKMAGLASEFQELAEERMKEVNAAYSALKRHERNTSPHEERTANGQRGSQAEQSSSGAPSGSAEAYFEQGQHCLDAQRYEEATALLTRTLQLQPDFTPAYLSLAIAYGSLLRRMEQIEALKQAIRLQPDFAWAHAFLGLAYVQIGETAAAAREYEILKTLDPVLAEKLPHSVREIHFSPSPLTSRPTWEQRAVSGRMPLISVSAAVFFVLLFLAGYVSRSRDTMSPSSSQNSDTTDSATAVPLDPLAALGRQYVLEMIAYAETEGGVSNERKITEVKGRIEELRLNKPVANSQEKKVSALARTGLAHLHETRFAEAIRVFQEAARLAPEDNESLENLGDAYLRNGDLLEAQQTLLHALVLVPGQVQVWVNLGQTYARIGNFTAAVACFANAYRFSPDREGTRQVLRNLVEKENVEAAVRDTVGQALRLKLFLVNASTDVRLSEETAATGALLPYE